MNVTIKELNITSNDINNFENLDELKVLKIEVDNILGRLHTEIDDYNLKFIKDGISGDYEWFKKIKTKKKLYGLMSQLMQIRIGFLGKQLKKENALVNAKKNDDKHSFYTLLMKKLKQTYGDETIQKLIDEVTLQCS